MKKTETLAIILRFSTALLVFFSIIVTYHVMITKKDYEILTNPDGPETEEYFEELFAE